MEGITWRRRGGRLLRLRIKLECMHELSNKRKGYRRIFLSYHIDSVRIRWYTSSYWAFSSLHAFRAYKYDSSSSFLMSRCTFPLVGLGVVSKIKT